MEGIFRSLRIWTDRSNQKKLKNWKKIFDIFDPLRGTPNLPPEFGFGGRYKKSPRWTQKYALGEYACQKRDTYDNPFGL